MQQRRWNGGSGVRGIIAEGACPHLGLCALQLLLHGGLRHGGLRHGGLWHGSGDRRWRRLHKVEIAETVVAGLSTPHIPIPTRTRTPIHPAQRT